MGPKKAPKNTPVSPMKQLEDKKNLEFNSITTRWQADCTHTTEVYYSIQHFAYNCMDRGEVVSSKVKTKLRSNASGITTGTSGTTAEEKQKKNTYALLHIMT